MAGTYTVTIGLVDQATSKLDAINKRLAKLNAPADKFNASLEKFSKLTGLDEVGKKLTSLVRGAVDFARSLLNVITPLAAIGGAASLAGLYKLAEGFADLGVRLGLTSRQMGVSGVALQKLENVGRLANVPVAALDAGMQNLRDTMVDVQGGRAGDVAVMLNAVHISAADVALAIKDPIAALPLLAEKLRGIRDPTLQAKVATSLFGGAALAMLPLLRLSAQEYNTLGGEVERHGLITLHGIEVSTALKKAMQGTAESVEGLTNSVLEKLSPSLTQLLDWFSKIIDANRDDWAGWMGKRVAELAAWLESPAFTDVLKSIGDIGRSAVDVAKFFWEWRDAIVAVFAIFEGAKIAMFLGKMALMAAKIGEMAGLWRGVESAAAAAKAAEVGAAAAVPAEAAATGVGALIARAAAFAASRLLPAAAFGYALYGGDAGPANEQAMLDAASKKEGLAPLGPLSPSGGPLYQPGNSGLDRRPILPGSVPNYPSYSGPGAPMAIPVQPAAAQGVRAANEERAFDYWQTAAGGGYSKEQAAGMVARMHFESGGDPANIGDGGAARGYMQWHKDRRDAIKARTGIDVATDMNPDDQAKAVTSELANEENPADKRIRSAATAYDAGYKVSRSYIRPGLTEDVKEWEARRTGDYAEEILARENARQARGAAAQLKTDADAKLAASAAALKASVQAQAPQLAAPAAPVAQGAALAVGGAAAKSASEQTLTGSATITVRHVNPPPGSTVQATTAGPLFNGAPKIETPLPQMAGP